MSRPIVFVGPSGIGKGTVINTLMEEFPGRFAFSISHTTRNPREGETNGVQYHFISREQFEADIAAGKFLETCEIHGNLYGTSYAAIEAVSSQGKICVLDINIDGAMAIHKTKLNPYIIFFKPVSLELLEERLRGRGTETEEVIQVRMNTAREEMRRVDGECNYIFNQVIVNDKLDETLAVMHKVLKDVYNLELI